MEEWFYWSIGFIVYVFAMIQVHDIAYYRIYILYFVCLKKLVIYIWRSFVVFYQTNFI